MTTTRNGVKYTKELVTKTDEDGSMFAYYIAPNNVVLYRKQANDKTWKMISDNIFAENKYIEDVSRPMSELKFVGENSKMYREEM